MTTKHCYLYYYYEGIELQQSQKNNLQISEDFIWEIKFSKTDLEHNKYCKGNVSRDQITNEISSKPDDNMDFETFFCEMIDYNFILFVGEPKIGKTMLVKKIALDCFENKRFDYIFFCNLNSPNPLEKIFLFDFLVSEKSKPWMTDKKTYDPVLEKLVQNDKILLILDEFNEMKFDKALKPITKVGVFNKDTPETFLINILKKNILSNWKKIIVTRPFQLQRIYQYDNLIKILKLKVLGFDYHSQAEMQSNQILFSIFSRLNVSNDFQSVGFVPYICKIFEQRKGTNILIRHFKDNSTKTSLFAILFLKYFDSLNKQYGDKLALKELVDFSWSQFSYPKQLRLCFDRDHLQNFSNSDGYLNCFFTTVPGSSLFGFERLDYKSHFSHILIQEFLLALKVMLLPEDEFKRFYNDVDAKKQLTMVIRFIEGFFSMHTEIESYLKQLDGFSTENLERKKNCLKELRNAQQIQSTFCCKLQ